MLLSDCCEISLKGLRSPKPPELDVRASSAMVLSLVAHYDYTGTDIFKGSPDDSSVQAKQGR